MKPIVPKRRPQTLQRQMGITLLMAFMAITLQANYSQQQSFATQLLQKNLSAVFDATNASLDQGKRLRVQLIKKVQHFEAMTLNCLQRTQKF
jgi:hypothetical protein